MTGVYELVFAQQGPGTYIGAHSLVIVPDAARLPLLATLLLLSAVKIWRHR